MISPFPQCYKSTSVLGLLYQTYYLLSGEPRPSHAAGSEGGYGQAVASGNLPWEVFLPLS